MPGTAEGEELVPGSGSISVWKYFRFMSDVNQEQIISRVCCRVIEASNNTPQTAV